MVCVACLLPLFLIPVVNALPLLFDFIIRKIYGLLGWEYIKPVRVPPACPYKPATVAPVEGSQKTPAIDEPLNSTIKDAKEE